VPGLLAILAPVLNLDWYFDLQLYQDKQTEPYEVLMVEPGKIKRGKGVYRLTSSLELHCNSTWAVQIALRTESRFARWLFPRSDRIPLGPSCAEGN
jgi:hypothetical protein